MIFKVIFGICGSVLLWFCRADAMVLCSVFSAVSLYLTWIDATVLRYQVQEMVEENYRNV